jgi:ABC-2 type transport system ATP-binding protein
MVKIDRLTKRFGNLAAVNAVSLEIARGEIFGLLGPNGAGKTTLINLLCGLLAPSAGSISIGGLDSVRDGLAAKRLIGVVPQDLAIYEELTAAENVRFFASLYGLRGAALKAAVAESLEFTGLADSAGKLPATFSGGMKRRLNIACGLAHKPELIVMDEPTVGIDPQSRHHILETVRRLNKQGCTVIYTTHYMEEAEALCTRSAIIDHGKIIAVGANAELQALVKAGSRYALTLKGEYPIDTAELEKIPGVLKASAAENRVYVDVDRGVANVGQIVGFFAERELPILSLELDAPNLEMVFLALTGRKLRD